MAKYGNHAQAGFGMIVVAASLAAIGLIALGIGEDVLFADDMQRDELSYFNECKENDFKADGCEKYWDRLNTEISGIYIDFDE